MKGLTIQAGSRRGILGRRALLASGTGLATALGLSAPAHADADVIGGAGDDKLFGGPSRDRLLGGPGLDLLVGGPGKDRERQ